MAFYPIGGRSPLADSGNPPKGMKEMLVLDLEKACLEAAGAKVR